MENITLRDYFAVESLKAIIQAQKNDHTRGIETTSNGFPIDRGAYTRAAYQYADSMIESRKAKE